MTKPRFDRLDDWLAWLETLHPTEIELGLERVHAVAQTMALLDVSATCITVAGTNGKGSFVCATSALLLREGSSVGAYTSPHIHRFNERICINGKPASDSDLCEAFACIDHARASTSLTYFEFATLAALYVFKKYALDYYVLEVGLGGRLDAVNIVDPDVAVITSIGLDHEAWLGSDRESIGYEKAGILRKSIPFICVDKDIPESVIARSKALACRPYLLGQAINIDDDRAVIDIVDAHHQSLALELESHHLPLPSLAAAAQVGKYLFPKLSTRALEQVLSSTSLAARFEAVSVDGRDYLLDVAHNPQAAQLCAWNLKRAGHTELTAIFTCMKDKNLRALVQALIPYVAKWVCVDLPAVERCQSGEQIRKELAAMGANAEYLPSVAAALQRSASAASLNSRGPTLIFGSFYLIAEVKSLWDTK